MEAEFLSSNPGFPTDWLYQPVQAAITKYHRLALTTEMYFLTVLEAGKSKINVPAKGSLTGLQMTAFSLCPHMVGKTEREWGEKSSHKDTNPVGSGPHPYDLI